MSTPLTRENAPSPSEARREPRMVPLSERLTWTLDDIALLTGLCRRTLERLRSAGRFPPPDIKIGKRPLWKPETIRRWIESGGGR